MSSYTLNGVRRAKKKNAFSYSAVSVSLRVHANDPNHELLPQLGKVPKFKLQQAGYFNE